MAKFARPNSYNGKQSNQSWTGQTRAATAAEAAAGDAEQLYISPATLASAVGDLVPHATDAVYGTVLLTAAPYNTGPAATKGYVDNIAIMGSPAASETNPGIAEIATQTETDTGTDDLRFVTPLKLANFVGAGGFPGSFTDLTATGAVSFTGATGAIVMTSATASSFGTTGAGIDLTLDSAAGRVVINGEEAAADAVRILSAAGGLDVDIALQMSLVSSQNAADAIVLNASAGGIDITAAGAAGEDIDIVNTAGSVNITAGESGTDAIVISATIGGIQINAPGAAAGEDIALTATGSSIRLVSTENVTDSIVLSSTNGGVQILAPGAAAGEDIVLTATGSSVRLTATENVTDAINIEATLGGLNILASGASAGEDINITATGSSVNVNSTENAALAIYLHANGGTSETIQLHADQGTGVASINVLSDVGGLTLRAAGLASADAINLEAVLGGIDADAALQINVTSSQAAVNAIRLLASDVAGGIDIDCGTGGATLDSTGAISLDAAAASNFTVTGAFALDVGSTLGKVTLSSGQNAADSVVITSLIGGIDILAAGAAAGEDIDIIATGSSVNIQATESDVNAITINASGAAGGINVDAGSNGVIVDTTGAISLDSATASNFTVTGSADLTLQSTAGAVNVISGEANADSINVTSAGGMSVVAVGAAAKDILITNTNGSMTLSAGESVTDAMNFTAGGVASGINLTAGTNGILLSSGQKVKVTAVVTGVDPTPYALLGTDYFVSVDTGAGVMTITLPAAPATGRKVTIYDGGGAAAGSNITIDGNGKNIAAAGTAAGTKLINTAYESYNLVYNGTLWLGQNVV